MAEEGGGGMVCGGDMAMVDGSWMLVGRRENRKRNGVRLFRRINS